MAQPGTSRQHYRHDALMRYARMLGFGEIHTKIDRDSGLHAIIAIHSTQLGPAIGGTRYYPYISADLALKDVLRLSYMMTLKAAVSDLPHGGAKAVIIKPKVVKDTEALFRAYGDFVHSLNGCYITAEDVGTTTELMNTIATRTPHVIGAKEPGRVHCQPSPHTAMGVFRGMQAAVQFKLNRDSLKGVHVAIQGVGAVGRALIELLTEAGARVSITDPKADALTHCVKTYGATAVALDDIYDVDCDIFAPCALGGTINANTIKRISAPIIAGSANNQLAHHKYAALLNEHDVLYAPDFVINSGGLINAAMVHDYQDIAMGDAQIDKLYNTLLTMFERAKKEKQPTTYIAEKMALEKLGVG